MALRLSLLTTQPSCLSKVWPSHDQHARQRHGKGNKRRTDAWRGAGTAQVKQTPLETHLPGVLPQRLPDGADFILTVGQRVEGTRVKSFPVAVTNKASSDRFCFAQTSFQYRRADGHCLPWIDLLANNPAVRWRRWIQASQTEL